MTVATARIAAETAVTADRVAAPAATAVNPIRDNHSPDNESGSLRGAALLCARG
jgi:hypothetical protein